MNNVTVLSGEVLSIQCPAAGFPLESIIWSKQSVKLPQNRRQTVFPNGTLIIDKVERNDQDVYRCSVSASGAFASRDVFVEVLVAPVINPFSSPPNLREGMRGMLTCSVLEGDPPVKIQFLKDGKLLRSKADNHIKLDSTNEFSSTLFISKVSFEDSGNYTCIASNSAASNSYSVKMIVNGKLACIFQININNTKMKFSNISTKYIQNVLTTQHNTTHTSQVCWLTLILILLSEKFFKYVSLH